MGSASKSMLVLLLPEVLESEWLSHATSRLDQEGRVIVLRGQGSVFCNGLPLARAASGTFDAFTGLAALNDLLCRLDEDPRPVLAIVEGDAKGGGVGLAAVADVVIARPEASFQLPEVLLGIIPADVFPWLARRVGNAGARRIALGEKAISAQEAFRRGLVDIVSESPDLELEAQVLRLARCEPAALAAVRRLASCGWDEVEATRSFERLWNAGGLDRIRRFENGETPWEESL